MKRTLCMLGSTLALLAPGMAAQRLAIKGGFSYGNVTDRGLLPGNLKTRTGFAIGVAFGGGDQLVSLGGEALYAQRGVTGGAIGDARRLDYLDVPLYVHVALSALGIAPYALAGPQISFELRCNAGGVACPNTDRAKVNAAGIIGGGIHLGRGNAVSIEGRYVYGLTDLKLGTLTNPGSYKTRSFVILAGLGF